MNDDPFQPFRDAFALQLERNQAAPLSLLAPEPHSPPHDDQIHLIDYDRQGNEQLGDPLPPLAYSNDNGQSLLDRLVTRNFKSPGPKNCRQNFTAHAWMAPYVYGALPRPSGLHQVNTYSLGVEGVSFFFPMCFHIDTIAIRLPYSDSDIDLCARIDSQVMVRTRQYGSINLIDCHFLGHLYLV